MGNCLERCSTFCQQDQETKKIEDHQHGEGDQVIGQLRFGLEDHEETSNIGGLEKGGFQVKMVLTKEELAWLLLQLQGADKGGRSLKDVLKEMEIKGRSTAKGEENVSWKPSLESIMEAPEVQSVET